MRFDDDLQDELFCYFFFSLKKKFIVFIQNFFRSQKFHSTFVITSLHIVFLLRIL